MSEGPIPGSASAGAVGRDVSHEETVLLLVVTWGCVDGLARQAHQLVILQAEER